MSIPAIRLTQANAHTVGDDGDYVLYWMTAFRRTRYNFALEHAVDRAKQLGKPLLIFEALRVRYQWASDRMHRFVIEGMRDNSAALAKKPVTYFPYVEPAAGAAHDLLYRLAQGACTVVTDDYPCFFLPKMIDAVKDRLPAPLELVDSNAVMPLRQADRTFTVAHSYRRWMQKNIFDVLLQGPKVDPLSRIKLPLLDGVPPAIIKKWPAADFVQLLERNGIANIPIDHSVAPSPIVSGGRVDAVKRLKQFLAKSLSRYDLDRNHPDEHATTGLSPHLHFGHLSAHEVVTAVLDHESWTPGQAGPAVGKNHSFWNTSQAAEAFLDQMLTWREMGFNMTSRHPDTYHRFESLPAWAQATLADETATERPYVYSLSQFEQSQTHDELWNAAQRELVQTGVMHNYMRMLWGKKILHWTASPREALSIMIQLNNKYALDGRDPNSYSGIFWVLGRYDRAWGPKRPIFGSVRYMTSDSARKKLRLKKYLHRFAAESD